MHGAHRRQGLLLSPCGQPRAPGTPQHRSHEGRDWFRPSFGLVQASSLSGSGMVQVWFMSGSGLAPAWFRHGPCVVQVWFRYGSGMVRVWFRYGSGMVWLRFGSGMVHVWFRCSPLHQLSRGDERLFTFHWLTGHGSTECIRSRVQG